jgi:uncharacterized protein
LAIDKEKSQMASAPVKVLNRTERIQDVLRALRSASPDIIGSALVSTDGFVMASLLPQEIDEESVSAMAAALLGVGERICGQLMHSNMEQTYVRGGKGYVLLNAVGADSVLVVMTTPDAKLGLVFFDVKHRVADLLAVL